MGVDLSVADLSGGPGDYSGFPPGPTGAGRTGLAGGPSDMESSDHSAHIHTWKEV